MSDAGERATRGPGRPRSHEADRVILRAVLDVLAADGVSGLTMDAVALSAGVAKTTIYRRWPSKDELIIEAVRTVAADVRPPDTGRVRDDLVGLALELARVFTTTSAGAAARALIGELPRNPDLARAFRTTVLARRVAVARAVLERAVARGELPADLDAPLATELLVAPIFFRHLVSGVPLDRAFVERVVDHVLAAPPRAGGPGLPAS